MKPLGHYSFLLNLRRSAERSRSTGPGNRMDTNDIFPWERGPVEAEHKRGSAFKTRNTAHTKARQGVGF